MSIYIGATPNADSKAVELLAGLVAGGWNFVVLLDGEEPLDGIRRALHRRCEAIEVLRYPEPIRYGPRPAVVVKIAEEA